MAVERTNPQTIPKVDLPRDYVSTPVEIFQKRGLTEVKISQPKVDDISLDKIREVADNLSRIMESFNIFARFSVHEKTKDIMIRIYNANTNEIIREIPPKKILDMVAKMMEMVGILIDERG